MSFPEYDFLDALGKQMLRRRPDHRLLIMGPIPKTKDECPAIWLDFPGDTSEPHGANLGLLVKATFRPVVHVLKWVERDTPRLDVLAAYSRAKTDLFLSLRDIRLSPPDNFRSISGGVVHGAVWTTDQSSQSRVHTFGFAIDSINIQYNIQGD